ncbi:MAG: acyl--CoA ligase [Conexivisphaerales archaeon]
MAAGGKTSAPDMANFSVEVPKYFNWGFDVIDHWAKEKPGLQALVYTDDAGNVQRFTFKDVSMISNQIANFLTAKGIKKGDAILVMLPNIPSLWFLVVALIKVGAVIVPCASLLTEKDLEYRIEAAHIRGIITDSMQSDKFSTILSKYRQQLSFAALADVREEEKESERKGWFTLAEAERESTVFHSTEENKSDDTCLIYFTSGTEGPPKMVLHTHVSYPLGHKATALWLGLKEGYLHWNISSPGWAKHAWSSIFAPWNVGATTFAYNTAARFNASKHLSIIEKFRINSVCAAPTIWRMFLLEDLSKYDLSSLKSAASAGEPLNPEVISRFMNATGITIRDGYGQTETVLAIGNFPGIKIKPGSMGIANPFYDIDVVDDYGNRLAENQEGNIAIRVTPERPFALLKEYANDPERNKEAFRYGWYFTGDRAYKDEDGYFWYIGRADDVIKSSAYRIGPFEVESALIKHPAVVEAAVVPSPDAIRGSIVKAYVVLRKNYTPSQELADELAMHVAKETAPYKYPRRIEFVESLDPVKTISGKIRRKVLRMAEFGREEKGVEGIEFAVKSLRDS